MSDDLTEMPAVPPMPDAFPSPAPRRWLLPIAAGLAGAMVGAGGVLVAWGMSGSDAAPAFALTGTMTLTSSVPLDADYKNCTGGSGYDDIALGAAVTVYDGGGKVVGTGSLGAGKYASSDSTAPCVFRVSVPGVPGGAKFYQVEVSHRGKITVSSAEAKAGGFAASLG
jgi:hypothetical protein